MIGLKVAATCKVSREMVRRVNRAGLVRVTESGLLSVCVWKPAKKVIEAAILHHDNDDMLDAGTLW